MSDLSDAIVEQQNEFMLAEAFIRWKWHQFPRCTRARVIRLMAEYNHLPLDRDGCAAIEAQIARLEEQL